MFLILLSYTLGQSFPQRWVYNIRKGKFWASNSKILVGWGKRNPGARAKQSLRRPTVVYEGFPTSRQSCPLPSQNSWKCGLSAENEQFQLSPGDSIAALWCPAVIGWPRRGCSEWVSRQVWQLSKIKHWCDPDVTGRRDKDRDLGLPAQCCLGPPRPLSLSIKRRNSKLGSTSIWHIHFHPLQNGILEMGVFGQTKAHFLQWFVDRLLSLTRRALGASSSDFEQPNFLWPWKYRRLVALLKRALWSLGGFFKPSFVLACLHAAELVPACYWLWLLSLVT